MTLVIASRNCGKIAEISALLKGLDVFILPLDRVGPVEVPPESGDSFQANARLKAVAVSRATGYFCVADDSGLEVDALGGDPGVFSARFGGPSATDADRNRMILDRMAGVPPERRTARFRCVIAVADPAGPVYEGEGTCEGVITLSPRGQHGFGYDPIFEIPSLGRTLAEVDPEEKNRLSHRAKAMARAREILREILGIRI
jgi:XTP/dITP diphosphohydrolase